MEQIFEQLQELRAIVEAHGRQSAERIGLWFPTYQTDLKNAVEAPSDESQISRLANCAKNILEEVRYIDEDENPRGEFKRSEVEAAFKSIIGETDSVLPGFREALKSKLDDDLATRI